MAPGRKTATTKSAKKQAKVSAKPAKKAEPSKKATKKIEEPISESEESEAEETIYEEMSDSAAEDSSSDESEEESAEEPAEESAETEANESADEESADEIDEEALLAGIKGSDSELSESEEENEFTKGDSKIDLDDDASKQIQKRLSKLPKKSQKSGVVYVGRIPHGFYEEEMLSYFKQFGAIRRLRLSRNPRTGQSRHYGFIEFAHQEVAQVVADTMDNYLMFDHLLKCKMMPEDRVHPRMFANRFKKIVPGASSKEHARIINQHKTQEQVDRQMDRLVKAEKKRRARIQAAGIEYDFPGYAELKPPKPKHIKF
ncbi:nucleolar protein [Coemansia sp. RSA 989]|nr:hypothetical protein BX667DRAFT_500410 [Coemansia mojavensis]KAJ1739272.1 nucleolar protein [Coemansia sp. RSA 1086]KAJ1747916.1 nucleolar protein [Coemansia sp. RSA 1821]KAJ1862015.1 nucleolar protein [Coemansia sp. RSA 989]KAJ1869926.1 nucleolar protein [Coemansia sp. RSA 990]KAJ2628382.1 nucleolar protein [Coemansia sp. RSA 1290]KAJ2651151.1 nucleolar protein [Coemansia sp. RSA 1250]KAJ2672987.1 nucleolar protein [Coemansia sp. RSA 1085]